MKKWLIFVGLALLTALVACGGQPSGGNGGGGGSLDPRDVAAALGSAGEQTNRLAQSLSGAGVPVPVVAMPFSSGVAPLDTSTWNCDAVTASGDLTDADGDNIPVSATLNGRCTWSYNGGEESFHGYWEYDNLKVEDPSDTDPAAGIKASGKITWGFTSESGSLTMTWTIEKHDFVKQGSGFNFAYKGTWEANTDEESFSFNYDYSGTLTPDDMEDPWGNGTMSATGSFGVGPGNGCTNGWSVEFTLTNVHFATCGVDSGSADFTFNDCEGGSCTITIAWHGCSDATYGGTCMELPTSQEIH